MFRSPSFVVHIRWVGQARVATTTECARLKIFEFWWRRNVEMENGGERWPDVLSPSPCYQQFAINLFVCSTTHDFRLKHNISICLFCWFVALRSIEVLKLRRHEVESSVVIDKLSRSDAALTPTKLSFRSNIWIRFFFHEKSSNVIAALRCAILLICRVDAGRGRNGVEIC